MQPAYLTHSLIENRGDDASVGMSWWTGESPVEAEAADEARLLSVVNETQAQSSFIVRTATKALVTELALLNMVAVNCLVPGHTHQDEGEPALAQVPRTATIRTDSGLSDRIELKIITAARFTRRRKTLRSRMYLKTMPHTDRRPGGA